MNSYFLLAFVYQIFFRKVPIVAEVPVCCTGVDCIASKKNCYSPYALTAKARIDTQLNKYMSYISKIPSTFSVCNN